MQGDIVTQWHWIAVGLGPGIAIGWILGWLFGLGFASRTSGRGSPPDGHA
jgi:hypothetical protein